MKTDLALQLKDRKILIAISGSIAAVKSPLLVSSLIKDGANIRCVITPSAARLVSAVSLATLSRHKCYQDEDQWNPTEPKPLHIALAEWAEIIVIAPLSASSLGRWAQGIGEGLLASVLLASEKPKIAAVAMNSSMWNNLAVQKNWGTIQKDPTVLPLVPSSGLLACDRTGDGRMVEPELIQLAIKSGLIQSKKDGSIKRDFTGQTFLTTAGPTLERLDAARIITNRSSGKMGVLLAQAARFRGAKVNLIHGPLQIPQNWLEGLIIHPIKTSQEMKSSLQKLQPSADVIAMVAAVADLRKAQENSQIKLTKRDLLSSLLNNLEVVPDLLKELVQNKKNNQLILGFTALAGNDAQIQKAAQDKKLQKECDLLMANPIDRDGQGFEENSNGGFLIGPKGVVKTFPVTSKLVLAHQLLDAIHRLQVNISDSKK